MTTPASIPAAQATTSDVAPQLAPPDRAPANPTHLIDELDVIDELDPVTGMPDGLTDAPVASSTDAPRQPGQGTTFEEARAALMGAFEEAGCISLEASPGTDDLLDQALFPELPSSTDYVLLHFRLLPRPGVDEAALSCSLFAPTAWVMAWAQAPASARPLAPCTQAVHGICHGKWFWALFGARLAATHQRMTIAWTQAEHGDGDDASPWAGHTIRDVTLEDNLTAASRVTALMERVLGLPHAWIDLLGHSAGAMLATELARRAAERERAADVARTTQGAGVPSNIPSNIPTGETFARYRSVTALSGVPPELMAKATLPLLGSMLRRLHLRMLWRAFVRGNMLALFATPSAATFSLLNGAHGQAARTATRDVTVRLCAHLCPESPQFVADTQALGASNARYRHAHGGQGRSLGGQRTFVIAGASDRLISVAYAHEGARVLENAPIRVCEGPHDLALAPMSTASGQPAWVAACDTYAQLVAPTNIHSAPGQEE